MPTRLLATVALFLGLLAMSLPAAAQDRQAWVQIEARPTLDEAQVRADAYAALFPETRGFRLRSGWYAIVLGPYPRDEAARRLRTLRDERLIPGDSFVALGGDFTTQYWPPQGAAPQPPAPVPAPPAPTAGTGESRAEARAAEAALTEGQRRDLQVALEWFGFYAGAIDGAFGPGTRNAMAAWQTAQGMAQPTGVLTTRQRADLLAAYAAETASFGFAEVTDDKAGITITLPLGLVEFDHYEPPFVHYRAKGGDGPGIVLISQPGDQAELSGLYDTLQTLEAVPLTGERSRGDRSFRITGQSATRSTTAYAEVQGGLIKGWMLISTPGNAARDARILQRMEASFAPDPTRALDPGMVPMAAATRAGLLSGLELRQPRFSRSGFYVDAAGTVLTTSDAVQSCGRITLDRATEATVTLADPASGLAVLKPATPLVPQSVAQMQLAPERPGTAVMVAGYSYEARLPAPVMTFGRLEAVTGLNGEPGLKRLAIDTLPGDVGGPVLDSTGAVIGLLLAPAENGDRLLPQGVQFALAAPELARVLQDAGVVPVPAATATALPQADLTRSAIAMTVLVSCWD